MKGTPEKGNVLGIDFGTTYTFVIKCTKDRMGELHPIGDNKLELYENTSKEGGDVIKYSNGIRTVIGYSDKKGWKIGGKAIEFDRENSGEMKICFNLKEKLLMIAKELPNVLDSKNNQPATQKNQDDQEKLGYIDKRIRELEEIEERIDAWINKCIQEGKMEIKDLDEKYGYVFNVNGNDKFYNAIKLTKIFFNLLFNCDGVCTNEQDPMEIKSKSSIFNLVDFHDVECIVIGAPAADMGTDDKATCYSEVILQGILCYIAKNILGLEKIEGKDLLVIPEPQLAGKAFIAEKHIQELCDGEQLLVIDIGGGTTDFAVLAKDKGKYFAPIPASGDIEIAGNRFDMELEDCVKKNYNTNGENFSNESVRTAKEQLFLTKSSTKIKYLVEVNKEKEEYRADKERSTKDKIYNAYLKHGRRTEIKSKDGVRPYGVIWAEGHDEGIDNDSYNKENFKNLVNYYQELFNDQADLLVEELKKYVNMSEKVKKLKWKGLKVLFVGGSSRMKELCEELCEKGLGLNKVGNEEEGYRWYKCEGYQQCEIHCYFNEAWENEASKLTCANMIAIGAVRFAQDQLSTNSNNAIYSVPTLLLGIPIFENDKEVGMNYYPLISQDMKNGVFENLKEYISKEKKEVDFNVSNWPYVFRYNMEKEKCVRFIILRQVQSTTNIQWNKIGENYVKFPRRNHQYYAFDASRIAESICDESKDYCVLFLADRPQGGKLAIFVCILKKKCSKNDEKYLVTKYNYGTPNGSDDKIANLRAFKNSKVGAQLIGTNRYCKRYSPYGNPLGEESGDQQGGLSGRQYSIQKWANSERYGWILKKQEVSNHAGDGK